MLQLAHVATSLPFLQLFLPPPSLLKQLLRKEKLSHSFAELCAIFNALYTNITKKIGISGQASI